MYKLTYKVIGFSYFNFGHVLGSGNVRKVKVVGHYEVIGTQALFQEHSFRRVAFFEAFLVDKENRNEQVCGALRTFVNIWAVKR